MDIKTMQK